MVAAHNLEPGVAIDATTDEQLVTRVIEGHVPAFTVLMRRYNRRLFRVVRGVLHDDAEAEDACQDAWMRAYGSLERLQHGNAFSTWLCRIGLRCALERMPQRRGFASLDELDRRAMQSAADICDPETILDAQTVALSADRALELLIPSHRVVLLMRYVEHMTTSETAAILEVSEENVRVRLHRARARLRELVVEELGAEVEEILRFDGERCDRLVGAVVRGIYSEARYATRSARSPSVSSSSNSAS
jgi:RNA polymerase sigma-70 factor (ECF subfamily)